MYLCGSRLVGMCHIRSSCGFGGPGGTVFGPGRSVFGLVIIPCPAVPFGEAFCQSGSKVNDAVPKALEWVENDHGHPKGIVLSSRVKVGHKVNGPSQQKR